MEKKLLITGFDPFGGEKINPAWEAVQALPEKIGAYRLHKLLIPTVFGEAAHMVLREAEQLQPEWILSIGQAGGRSGITPERIGINMRSASLCDNRGNRPQEQKILPDGPDGIFSPLPVAAMAQAIRDAGIPAWVSDSAGTFVCNDVLYTVLAAGWRAGFLHVPWLPEQGTPCLSLSESVRGLEAAIGVL